MRHKARALRSTALPGSSKGNFGPVSLCRLQNTHEAVRRYLRAVPTIRSPATSRAATRPSAWDRCSRSSALRDAPRHRSSHHLRTGSSAVTHGCSQASLRSGRTGLWISEIERTIRIFGSSKLRRPRRPASFVAKLLTFSTRGDCKAARPNESDEAVHCVWRGSPMTPQPTLKWYTDISASKSLSPRCPFASVHRCPRYYQSVSLLGEAGVATAIEPEEDSKLLEQWKRTDLWPVVDEQHAAVRGRPSSV